MKGALDSLPSAGSSSVGCHSSPSSS